MELKDLLKIFGSDTQISVENFNKILYIGTIGQSNMKDSNLEVVEGEIRDNILHIQVAL